MNDIILLLEECIKTRTEIIEMKDKEKELIKELFYQMETSEILKDYVRGCLKIYDEWVLTSLDENLDFLTIEYSEKVKIHIPDVFRWYKKNEFEKFNDKYEKVLNKLTLSLSKEFKKSSHEIFEFNSGVGFECKGFHFFTTAWIYCKIKFDDEDGYISFYLSDVHNHEEIWKISEMKNFTSEEHLELAKNLLKNINKKFKYTVMPLINLVEASRNK